MIQLPTLAAIRQSEFWQFFNLSILREIREGELTYYRLQTGGFRSEVDLMLVIDDRGQMSAGFLALNRAWVSGPPHGLNPFALDITRGFIHLAIGGQGKAADNFLLLFQDFYIRNYRNNRNPEDSASLSVIQELETYLGKLPEVMRRFPGCDIRFKNAVAETRETLQVIISSTL